MPQNLCKICNSTFYVRPNWIPRGWGKYCSKACQNEAQKKGQIVDCFMCKKSVYKPRSELRKSLSGSYFCNKSCQTVWRNSIVFIGERHVNWKGGETIYRDIILRSGVQAKCKRCGNEDKRILAVHHIDHSRRNNSIKNLIWLCPNCHVLIHRDREEESLFLVELHKDKGEIFTEAKKCATL